MNQVFQFDESANSPDLTDEEIASAVMTSSSEDRRGHRYTVSEYESMYLRLNQSWKLCQDGNLVEARNKMFIVRSWLNAANGQSTDE